MGVKETALYAVGAVASQCKKNWINFNLNFQRYCITVGNNVSKHYKVYISIYSKYCTSHKETCRMIPRLTLDSRHGGLCVLFFFNKEWTICMCVWECVHVCGFLFLSLSTRPLCRHTLQRAPSCHSWQHTAWKNVTMRGRWETKREKYTQRESGKWRESEAQQTATLPWWGSIIFSAIPHPPCSTPPHTHICITLGLCGVWNSI